MTKYKNEHDLDRPWWAWHFTCPWHQPFTAFQEIPQRRELHDSPWHMLHEITYEEEDSLAGLEAIQSLAHTATRTPPHKTLFAVPQGSQAPTSRGRPYEISSFTRTPRTRVLMTVASMLGTSTFWHPIHELLEPRMNCQTRYLWITMLLYCFFFLVCNRLGILHVAACGEDYYFLMFSCVPLFYLRMASVHPGKQWVFTLFSLFTYLFLF